MCPAKRRTPGKRRKGPTPPNRARRQAELDSSATSSPQSSGARAPEPTGRYTPPIPKRGPFRPLWHKVTGAALIVAGSALFFTCQFNGWGIHDYGGHIWYLVGLTIAASSLWWFGALDGPRNPPDAPTDAPIPTLCRITTW